MPLSAQPAEFLPQREHAVAAAAVPLPRARIARVPGRRGDEEPSELQSLGSVCNFARNATILEEGQTTEVFYRVVSGVVRLCHVTEDGRRQITGFRFPGDLLGVEWLDRCEMTAEAVRDVIAVRYARARFDRLMNENPAVRDHLLAHIREDLRHAHEHLLTLGCQNAIERVSAFIVSLARRCGAADGSVLDMQLGRQDIADYLGLTLETVSRTFSELQSRGMIALPRRRHIVINSLGKLRSHAPCVC